MPPHQRADGGFPAPSMQPISVDFIENRDAGFRNAEGELPCNFDPSSQKFVAAPFAFGGAVLDHEEEALRESKLRVVATKESFAHALAALKSKKKSKNEAIANFDLNSYHDWEEITEHIDLVAMTQHAEIREKMAELLKEVPEIVNQCEQYQTLYPGRNTIQLCVNDIYINLLLALEEIIRWYTQSSWKHTRDSISKNSNYSKAIDECLKRIRQSKTRFLEETQLYSAWVQRATLSTVLQTNAQNFETNSTMHGIDGSLTEFRAEYKDTMKTYGEGMNALMETLDDVVKNAKWHDEKLRYAEVLRQQELNAASQQQRIMELEEQVAKAATTPQQFMEELRLKPAKHTHVSEVPMVRKHGLNSSTKFQNRAGWVGNTTEFRDWLGGPDKSQILCVQGHGAFEPTSPLSFLISLLYEKLEQAPRTLVLPFFCGRSTVSSGPAIMARALFVQLLAMCDKDGHTGERGRPLLSFLGHDEKAQMKELDLETYTDALAHLLRDLRKDYSAMFILIDGIEYYDSKWEDEMDDFVKSIRKLGKSFNKPDEETSGGVLRVLLTASSWSRRFSPPPKSLAVLDVPEYIDSSLDGFERFA
ncbi:hypothetical protein J4E90_009941 [Alternaria incomplexa]|uniref:uncharacterized protein n=1 Tax=Alternaria incomplexa TaxID=1187928 RepID=UPI002220FF53|nr:uncharacterized protein J4E90_009941 [Alternaria incomplexa]KAI4907047.1 hypothetical protein J4E90_009941 [Alternaria incomplexa]